MEITMTPMDPIHKRQRACLYIYKGENRNAYIYANSKTLCNKQDNLRYVFIHKNPTLYVTQFFMKILKLPFIYIQKA